LEVAVAALRTAEELLKVVEGHLLASRPDQGFHIQLRRRVTPNALVVTACQVRHSEVELCEMTAAEMADEVGRSQLNDASDPSHGYPSMPIQPLTLPMTVMLEEFLARFGRQREGSLKG
jgi:hypothetical protein